MNTYKLSFCKIHKISDSICEVIVHEGIEMDMVMLVEYHNWIKNNLVDPCGLLVNKIHSYTYTFEAQMNIANLPMIKAIAVITYSSISEVATKNLTKLPSKVKWNLQTFSDRDIGLEWVKNELINENKKRSS